MNHILSTSALTLRVGQRTLVENLDWRVQAGECWCVIGRNGAGKSTLLRTLAGLRASDGGTVNIAGRALDQWEPQALARQRAFLPQSRSDAFAYRVRDAVLAARHPYQGGRYWETGADQDAAQVALVAMQVAHLGERDIRSLSGGERQRVAIAAMLAQDTPLLLLDEPANALDLAHQVSSMNLLARLCREQNKTVIMIGHDLNLAYSAASHALLLMGDGRWQLGPVADAMQAPLLSTYLGHPIESIAHGERTIFIPTEETA